MFELDRDRCGGMLDQFCEKFCLGLVGERITSGFDTLAGVIILIAAGVTTFSHAAPFPFLLDLANDEVSIWRIPHRGQKTIYLTFDDGPNPKVTPPLLRNDPLRTCARLWGRLPHLGVHQSGKKLRVYPFASTNPAMEE